MPQKVLVTNDTVYECIVIDDGPFLKIKIVDVAVLQFWIRTPLAAFSIGR